MSAYRAVSPEEGLYDGPIDGWFAIYHRSVLPLLLSLPYGQYSTIGSTMKGQLRRRGLLGLLCTRMRVFHAIGPHYAAHFGMLSVEVEKYRRLQRHDIEAWYRGAQDALPATAILEQQVAMIARSLATAGPW
jgi:hypothetical protein